MDETKQFYTTYSDEIRRKRSESKYPLRAYAHKMQYESVAQFVQPGMRVLDAGCGDGVLSFMLLERGALVTGTDISEPNIARAEERAKAMGVADKIQFQVADSENLPFPNNSFDLVVSSHVLEHLPDFDKGLAEIFRVTKQRAVVAIPTICNPCSWVQVAGSQFYLPGPRSFLGLFLGFFKMCAAFVVRSEGVNESYTGHEVPHVFRFPRIFREKVAQQNGRVIRQEASSVCLPFFSTLLPVVKFLDRYRAGVLSWAGYGTTYYIEKATKDKI